MRSLAPWVPLALSLFLAPVADGADRAVIVVLDGLRATEGFADPEARFIPRMANELAPQGGLCLACDNMGWTKTVSGHATLGSGRYQYLNNEGLQRPTYPLLWEYYRDQNGAGDESGLVGATKTKIKILSYSSYAGYGADDSARVYGPTWDDAAVVNQFLSDLQTNQPVVAMLNLGNIDMAGHTGVWADYTNAIVRADSLVAYLWNEIQSDPLFMDQTAMIISGDHGRHADGYGDWSSHGDGCPGCRRIPLLVLGPDFPPGIVSEVPCQQNDVCPTIGSILGIETPQATGRVLTELLEDPAGVDEPDRERDRGWRIWTEGGAIHFAHTEGTAPLDLSIYDVSGRLVANRVLQSSGRWSWNTPTSGVLFYRVTSPDDTESGRLVPVR